MRQLLSYKLIAIVCIAFNGTIALAQGSYAPQVGIAGSTAIPADSSCFRDWAISCDVDRGPQQVAVSSSPDATSGAMTYAVGKADAPLTISLGDGGVATLQFSAPIFNGEGYDFAIFENGFIQGDAAFLELAFVEVSSNGIDFIRFPAYSETNTDQQVNTFETLDASNIHNLAGKYIANYGTPFDLDEVPDTNVLDKSRITHIRVVDCIGTVDSALASFDQNGRIINDPWPTDFESGGFDLDAIGVINSLIPLGIPEEQRNVSSNANQPSYDLMGRPIGRSTTGILIQSAGVRLNTIR